MILAVASSNALPQYYGASDSNPVPFFEILKDDRVYPDASGAYSFLLETENGISWQEAGQGTGPDGAVEASGSYRFALCDDLCTELRTFL